MPFIERRRAKPPPVVQGHCPMGCGETLFLAEDGYVTCSWINCPRPDAVSDILEDRETEHVVRLGEETFAVKHPLKERVEDDLFECTLHDDLRRLDGPPAEPGRYRVRPHEVVGWIWEPLDGETAG